MQGEKRVSVIVPCYNSAQYLKTSIDSLLAQYYENIEIVCVNDGSTDETGDLLKKFAQDYDSIKVVTLPKNKGLFNARVEGVANSTGDYIAFVDSDDFVTPNWIGELLRKAETAQADLVLGDMRKLGEIRNKTVDPQRQSFQNLDPLRFADLDEDGVSVLDRFLSIHGLCSNFHYVWNKLIRRDLWQKCLGGFESLMKSHPHLVMGEDIAFSTTFFLFAQHVVNIHNEYYIYCIHEGQSVDTSSTSKFNKNISDLKAVFEYVKYMFGASGLWDKYESRYLMFKRRYGIIYLRRARELNLPNKIKRSIEDYFELNGLSEEEENEIKSEYYFSLMTNVHSIDGVYRSLVEKIYSPMVKVVSFDIFDTLVLRPFVNPADIFTYLNVPFNKEFNLNAYVDFSSQRRVAEEHCHKLQKALKPGIEEPTLSEIYDVIAANYGYDREKLRKIEQLEIENEIRFAYPRKAMVDLFEQAKAAGKKVIISSDMYLPHSCITAILDKCGINGYDKLYLSSDLHLTKHSGRMYPVIIRDFKKIAGPRQILHIGDNYNSDIKRAREYDISAQHCPKTVDLFKGRNGGIYTGRSYDRIFKTADRYVDMELAFSGYSGLRSACAVAANRIFDFPYVNFNRNSDFNGDPRIIGYYPVGMHVFAVARWLIKKVRGKNMRTLHFAARDGYLIKQAYDILSEGMTDVPKSNYIHLSRKALAIVDIKCRDDMHSIVHKMNFALQSPESLKNLFAPVMSERAKNSPEFAGEKFCKAMFYDRVQFDKYMVEFYDKYLTDADFDGYRRKLKDYFGELISPDDAFFDIGYSGRVELALKQLLGYTIKSFYIHTNNDSFDKRKAVMPFENETFYDFKPNITGVMREHILSEMSPSTIGYIEKDGKLDLWLDEYRIDYPTYFATKLVQDYALEYVADMKKLFGEGVIDLYCRDTDLSKPFEYYLHFSRSFDRNIFADSQFEDDLGVGHSVSGLQFWNESLGRINTLEYDGTARREDFPPALANRSRLVRAIYLFLFDRQLFKKKLGTKLRKNKKG